MFKYLLRFILVSWCLSGLMVLAGTSIGKSRNHAILTFVAVLDNRTDIYAYDPLSRERINITQSPRFTERSFGWSREGALFYIESGNPARPRDSLYVMYRIGIPELIEPPQTSLNFGISWSPDGNQIAYFSSQPRNISDIYLITFPGATVRNITQTESISELNPRWMPSGEQLLYQQDNDLYIIELATGERELLADIEASTLESPVPSPDGQFIIFYAQQWGNEGTQTRVFLISRDSGEMQELTLPETINSPVTWSPDGQRFALVTEDSHLLLYDITTHNTERVPGDNRRYAPAWSPDGRWIAFIENRQPHFYDLQTGHIHEMNTGGRIREPLIWQP